MQRLYKGSAISIESIFWLGWLFFVAFVYVNLLF
ncbi:hypothetical protein Cylst_1745 [Cylindrospermum stagnale PCC 7417]|uniref:Uncharacterized protein n=1 Tax=Cylindrospermum stagnale PCC 7417 TaxID=56107 RepID=K9WW44_9NOST|nr:hypothetical protein Cylst_1745 [Cylindrospermum stagnale PCC 7417]